MKAIALAAGFATRLHPLTKDRAKPLLEVAGRPVLSWLLDRLLRVQAVDEVVVVTNARFHDQFVAWRDAHTARAPIRLLDDGATEDENKRGAIGDLALAWNTIDADVDLLVAAGDNLLRFDLNPYADAFLQHRRPTILARRLAHGIPPGRHGEITLDDTSRITRFREKPQQPQSDLAAACLYFLPPAVRPLLAEYVAAGHSTDAPGNFIAWLVQQTEVHAAEFQEQDLFDIGSKTTLDEARRRFRPLA